MSKTDFDLGTISGVVFDVDGVLSPSTIPMDDQGVPCRMVNIKDGYALQHAAKNGLKIAIITGAKTPALIKRYQALGIDDVFIGASQKLPILDKWLDDNNLSYNQIAYCGDDIPDLPAMKKAALAVAPADAAVEALEVARYITAATGGHGVARELIEQIMRAQGKWMHDNEAFGW